MLRDRYGQSELVVGLVVTQRSSERREVLEFLLVAPLLGRWSISSHWGSGRYCPCFLVNPDFFFVVEISISWIRRFLSSSNCAAFCSFSSAFLLA